MKRFNPFQSVDCKYGAPMGRHGDDAGTYDGVSKLYARHCGGDGYYDRGGAYWGHSKVCAVWTRGGEWCAYVEAFGPEAAIALVKALAAGWSNAMDAIPTIPNPEGYWMHPEHWHPAGNPVTFLRPIEIMEAGLIK